MSSKNRAAGESDRLEYGSFSGTYTPPFPAESIASTNLSSQTTFLYISNLILRCFALLVCLLAALALALADSSTSPRPCSIFLHSSTYRYCVIIAIISSIYSALQLFKGICDFASGVPQLVSEKISDYTMFMLDQVVAYLLMSSSSTLVPFAIEMVVHQCGKLAAASAAMSFCAFFTIALSTLQSGYKLCKRIIW